MYLRPRHDEPELIDELVRIGIWVRRLEARSFAESPKAEPSDWASALVDVELHGERRTHRFGEGAAIFTPQPNSHPRSYGFNAAAEFSSEKLRFQRRSRILIREATVSTPQPNSHPRSYGFNAAAEFSSEKLPFHRRSRILIREATVSTPELPFHRHSRILIREATVSSPQPDSHPRSCRFFSPKLPFESRSYAFNPAPSA